MSEQCYTAIWSGGLLGFMLGNLFCYLSLVRPIIRLKDEHYARLEARYKKARGY